MSELLKTIAAAEHNAQQYAPVDHPVYNSRVEGFKEGAQWQKEQDKEIRNLARNLLIAYDTRHPNEPQLLLSISNIDALNKIIDYL